MAAVVSVVIVVYIILCCSAQVACVNGDVKVLTIAQGIPLLFFSFSLVLNFCNLITKFKLQILCFERTLRDMNEARGTVSHSGGSPSGMKLVLREGM